MPSTMGHTDIHTHQMAFLCDQATLLVVTGQQCGFEIYGDV